MRVPKDQRSSDVAPDGRAGRKFGTITHNAKVCVFPECERTSHCRGMCVGHWNQWAHGRELIPLRHQERVVDGKKFCSGCDRTLVVERFHVKLTGRSSQCRECTNIESRAKKYGLTPAQARELISRPCETCGAPPVDSKFVHIDHNHVTGVVRGVMCHACNTSLGLMNEDVGRMQALIDYLEQYQGSK